MKHTFKSPLFYLNALLFTFLALVILNANADRLHLPQPVKHALAVAAQITGTGTQNKLAVFAQTATQIGDSVIYDDGTNIGIGTTIPGAKLVVVAGSLPPGRVGAYFVSNVVTGNEFSAQLGLESMGSGETRLSFTDGPTGHVTGQMRSYRRTDTGGILQFFTRSESDGAMKLGLWIDRDGKVYAPNGFGPPFVSFSDESHKSIRQYAKTGVSGDTVMQFWSGSAHRMEVYVIAEDKFYTIDGTLIND